MLRLIFRISTFVRKFTMLRQRERSGRTVAPGEDTKLRAGDTLVLGAKPLDDDLEL